MKKSEHYFKKKFRLGESYFFIERKKKIEEYMEEQGYE